MKKIPKKKYMEGKVMFSKKSGLSNISEQFQLQMIVELRYITTF